MVNQIIDKYKEKNPSFVPPRLADLAVNYD